ncbi:MAG: MarR family winged helix-turn-helix transcriptional regulator [Bdellovibrionales bacterium]
MKQEKHPEHLHFVSRLMGLSLTLQMINKNLETKYGLSIVQWSLLKTLLNMPTVSPQVLAKALGVTPGTLSQTLGRLSRKRYLFICDDPTDARKKMISITRLGRDALVAASTEYDLVFSEIETVNDNIGQIDDFLKNKVRVRLLR